MNIHESDQNIAGIRDAIPRLWRQLYMGCLDQGFTAGQSFALLQTYILSMNGVRLPNNDKEDKPENKE